ncbi:UNKNOWN [Stylonychia lemnae]|uniref:Transmembrane protein n=1 Tax=Stylonychia lemnae TaxID=5949 RepID=A0A078AWB8_STYLE|nr:UNKNOWN [Stylonychia lemnae]|eukprot:CDW86434.1 UNKNOWN [Stylonychia lemnae]
MKQQIREEGFFTDKEQFNQEKNPTDQKTLHQLQALEHHQQMILQDFQEFKRSRQIDFIQLIQESAIILGCELTNYPKNSIFDTQEIGDKSKYLDDKISAQILELNTCLASEEGQFDLQRNVSKPEYNWELISVGDQSFSLFLFQVLIMIVIALGIILYSKNKQKLGQEKQLLEEPLFYKKF